MASRVKGIVVAESGRATLVDERRVGENR